MKKRKKNLMEVFLLRAVMKRIIHRCCLSNRTNLSSTLLPKLSVKQVDRKLCPGG
jgi:hypothetical protein